MSQFGKRRLALDQVRARVEDVLRKWRTDLAPPELAFAFQGTT